MYKTQSLEELKDLYKIELKKYNSQETWINNNPTKAETPIKGITPLAAFMKTLSNLGLIGWEMEERFNYYQTIEERFGKVGQFTKKVITQLDLL